MIEQQIFRHLNWLTFFTKLFVSKKSPHKNLNFRNISSTICWAKIVDVNVEKYTTLSWKFKEKLLFE